MGPLGRRATLDVIGRGGFCYDFGALRTARGTYAGIPLKGGGTADVVKVFDDILDTAMLLAFNIPLPDALIPGYGGYLKALHVLDDVVDSVLQVGA